MGNEPLAFPSVGKQRAVMLCPSELGGAGGHRARPCWSLGLRPGSCLSCIAPEGVYPEKSPPPPQLNGCFTSKSYSQINSINSGHSHFITPGSSLCCLPQGEANGAGKGWKTSSQESWSVRTPRQSWLYCGTAGATGQPDPAPALRPPGQSEALFDAGRHGSSKPPPLCLASMDDLFRHATPACYAASLQALYCLWPGLATSPPPSPGCPGVERNPQGLPMGLMMIPKRS